MNSRVERIIETDDRGHVVRDDTLRTFTITPAALVVVIGLCTAGTALMTAMILLRLAG